MSNDAKQIATAADWAELRKTTGQGGREQIATAQDWAELRFETDYQNYLDTIGKVDKGWLSPTDMQGVIDTVDTFSKKYKVDTAAYDKLMASLKKAQSFYSNFKNQTEYNVALVTDKYSGYTYDQIQDANKRLNSGLQQNKIVDPENMDLLQAEKGHLAYLLSKYKTEDEYNAAKIESDWQKKWAGSTAADIQAEIKAQTEQAGYETPETKWLKNYGITVGYSDSQSYADDIAALQTEIDGVNNNIKILRANVYVNPGSSSGGGRHASSVPIRPSKEEATERQNLINQWEQKRKELEAKKSYLERKLKEVQAEETIKQDYEPFRQAADFESKAVPNNEINDPLYQLANKTKWTGNDVEYFKVQGDVDLYSFLENDEKKLYLYLANEQGADAANQYFDTMRPILNTRKNTAQVEKVQKFADSVPVLDDILTLGSQLVDGVIMAPAKFIGGLTGDYEKNWAAYDTLTTFTNTIRTDTAQDLNALAGGEWAGFVYNTVMSIGDMALSIAVSHGLGSLAGAGSAATGAEAIKKTTEATKRITQIIMSSEAATQTMTSARERGLDGWQIAGLGLASAGIEWLTEKYSLDALFADPKKAVTHILKNMGTEAAEEATSNVLNLIADEVIAGNQSQIKQQIGDLMASGKSYEDAAQQVLLEKLEELGMDALGGALSGGIMGGGSVAINRLTTVHFSVPGKYKSDLPSSQSWVLEKFSDVKNNITVKKLGTVSYDAATMRDAIGKTKNADQAVAFLAVPDVLHKNSSAVEIKEDGKLAVVGAFASLNGNTHTLTISAQKMLDGGYFVNGVILDGEVIYDASAYAQQAQASETASQIGAQGVSSAADGLSDIDYSALEKYDQRTYTNRGWVVVNKVLTGKELKKFNSQWADAQKHKFKYPKATNGDTIITVGDTYASADTLVYTNGTYENPIITKVVKIVPKDPSDVSYLREEIVMGEDSGNEYIWAIVKSLAGEESFIFYTPQDFGTYSELTNARTERQGLQNGNGDSSGGPSGGGNGAPYLGENQGVVNNSTDTISLPPSDGGTGSFADAKNPTVDGDLGIIGVRASALDRAFMDMSEDERSSLIAAFEKNTGTRVVFDETIGADGKYENGVIYVNPNTATPMTVIKHELTHHLEQTGEYQHFMNFVFEQCDSFRTWLQGKGYIDVAQYAQKVIADRARAGHPLGQNGVDAKLEAEQEILGDFVGEMLFRDTATLGELSQKNRNLFQRIWDWVKGLFTRYEGTAMEKELREIEQRFAQVVRQNAATAGDGNSNTEKYSIQTSDDGTPFVEIEDRPISVTDTAKSISSTLSDLVKNKFQLFVNAKGQKIGINQKTAREWQHSKSAQNLLGSDKTAYLDKMNAFNNADELLQASRNYIGEANKHLRKDNFAEFARGKVDFRIGNNGYSADVIVGTTKTGVAVLYDIVNIQNKKIASTSNTAQDRRRDALASDPTVPQNGDGVNTQYTQNGKKNSIPTMTDSAEAVEHRRLSEDDLNEYLQAGSRENRNKMDAYRRGEKVMLVSEKEITDYINDVIAGSNDQITVAYGKVNDRLAKDVLQYSKGSIVIADSFLELVPDDLQHSYENHIIAKESGDVDLSVSDFKNIPQYLDGYDELLYAIRFASGNTRICVSKKLQNGRIIIIEGVSKSRGSLQFKNAIGVSEKKYHDEYLKKYKKGNRSLTEGDIKGPNISSHSETVSNNSIQGSSDTVKSNSMSNDTKYSVPSVLEAEKTAEQNTAVLEESERNTLDQFTDEQLRAEMRRRHPKGDIGDVANLKPEDASTTPDLSRSGVRNRSGDGESAFAVSLQGADIFDDRFKELAAADSKISRYDRIANKETMEAANRALNEGGQAYVNEWISKKTTAFTAEDVAVGFILMSRYQTVGDYKNEVIVAEKLREAGTQSGQTVQIFSILGRMTPQGMLLYAQKELNSAYEHLVKGQSNRWAEENKSRFDLTDQDVEFIQRRVWQAAQLPDGRDKNILLAEIAARIQDKIPPEKGQAYKAWQRTAMLLNPKTQIRNVLGNATMVPAFVASDFIGTGIDKALGKVTGVRTTSITRLSGKAFAQGLFESWDDFVRHINTRNIDADRFEISGRSSKNFNEQHTGFAAGARNNLSKALNALDRFNSFLLEAGDRSFYQMWFVNSLNSQMKANKITDRSQITADMVETATQEALQRTWQDTNKMTKSVSRVKETMNALSINGYGLGDVMIKFTKTPANLTKAMFDFSPAGFLKALTVDAKKFSSAVRDGSVTPQMQRTFVKNLSNGITGTILMAIGIALAQAGWITGEKDEDKDVAAFDRYVRGHQPYSVKIGNTSFSYDWMMPIGSSWAMAANYFDGKREGDDKNALQVVRDAISTGGQVLFDQSFMRSIQTLFSEDDILTSIVTGVLSDVSAPIPQALSQAAASIDPIVRNTYEYDDDIQTAWNKILYRIPGLRQTLAPSVDVMGNEIKQIDNGALRAITSFFSPMNVGKGYESKAADEVYRLYQATGQASMIPSQAPNYVTLVGGGKRTLDSHEKAAYQKATGGMIAESVEKLLSNKRYGALSDDEKAALLGNIYSYAKQKANNEVLEIEMNESAAKADGVISQGIPLYEYFLIRKTADANDNGSISQDEAREALDASGLTKTQKSLMWTAFNSNWKSNPYGKRYY